MSNKTIVKDAEDKIYCKKCGAWVIPENGECPRCGYVFSKRDNRLIIAALIIAIILAVKLL